MLAPKPAGEVYRIPFHVAGADPRIALRERADLRRRRSGGPHGAPPPARRTGRGPWTSRYCGCRRARGVRAGDLAAAVGAERLAFKTDIRKLKALGLTESLGIGYRLSPRVTPGSIAELQRGTAQVRRSAARRPRAARGARPTAGWRRAATRRRRRGARSSPCTAPRARRGTVRRGRRRRGRGRCLTIACRLVGKCSASTRGRLRTVVHQALEDLPARRVGEDGEELVERSPTLRIGGSHGTRASPAASSSNSRTSHAGGTVVAHADTSR